MEPSRSRADRFASSSAVPGSAPRPVSVAQILHHSISDPCDDPGHLALGGAPRNENARAVSDLNWHQTVSSSLPSGGPHAAWAVGTNANSSTQIRAASSTQFTVTPMASSGSRTAAARAEARMEARADSGLPSLSECANRWMPSEMSPVHGAISNGAISISSGISGTDGVGVKTRSLSNVSLPAVDKILPRAAAAPPPPPLSPSAQPPLSPVSAADAGSPAAGAAGADGNPSSSMLLAMCPGVPAGMRRRDWSLEDYEVSRRLYKSATSAVYRAKCRRSGLPVALKVYFLSKVPANVVHMIVREIKIHAELVHKNIVMLYAAFQDERRLVLVQEYAARGDLYGIHRAMNRRMTEPQVTELVLVPFLEALSYLHKRGVCHRDIKPENILFTQDWRLVIADFGVSINLNQERAVTRAGTLEYMAPEVERCPLKMRPEENKEKGTLAYTTAVDIWAVGVLAYELLVGFPPFVAENRGQGHPGHDSAGAAFLAAFATRKTLSFPSSASAGARDFISAALAERPEERPTAQALLRHAWLTAALERIAEECARVQAQQAPVRRAPSSSVNAGGPAPPVLTPSRLASGTLANGCLINPTGTQTASRSLSPAASPGAILLAAQPAANSRPPSSAVGPLEPISAAR
ncbi:hypothetical protein HYH03_009808 [Edaphochlamys debaryana]|uniref:Protein kinase domain-containing protein n=1 Tax=Edaphochlamys debaryana TaxID=47281 RepID=A0A835XVE0_9CHLO|nr:hypothetical protein HYH03_009808 [Edaphochlamys debaryana]|eukprot:KAG2491852.1 hypothetical protein HYH03_009808 [Edaphochlamys debaryana]